MVIMSHVAVEFHDIHGVPVFSVSGTQLHTLVDAPEEIRQDPIFEDLVRDGSVIISENVKERKALEYDPMTGITREGKAERKTVKAPENKAEAKAKPKADTEQ
jgi:hypothetical protein